MKDFTLTPENYHSIEANQNFMSHSQYKDFAGTIGMKGCEAMAMAKLRGEWKPEPSTALLVGSYVDAYFEGTLDQFKNDNPDIFTKQGELKAPYKQAEEMIGRAERDEYFMKTLQGEKQVIRTAELFGVKWKIKIDSHIPKTANVDLKTCASISETKWAKDYGRLNFIAYWGYNIQGAIYQKIDELCTGEKLPFLISAVSKEKEPDIEVIAFSQKDLDEALMEVESNMPRIIQVKNGEVEPDRCGTCDYCIRTKILTRPIHYTEIQEKI